MTVEDTFAKLVGRQASEAERTRLYRLRDALGLRDNDAFWCIVMALEHYDLIFRQYPAQLADETRHAISTARAAFAEAAASEAAQAQRALAERVAEASVQIARKLADKPVGVHRVTAALASVVAFGALCASSGYHLASAPAPGGSAFAAVLRVPAGWMIFALLVPAAAVGAKAGWAVAADPLADRRERIVGGCLVMACIAGALASAVVLAKVL